MSWSCWYWFYTRFGQHKTAYFISNASTIKHVKQTFRAIILFIDESSLIWLPKPKLHAIICQLHYHWNGTAYLPTARSIQPWKKSKNTILSSHPNPDPPAVSILTRTSLLPPAVKWYRIRLQELPQGRHCFRLKEKHSFWYVDFSWNAKWLNKSSTTPR